jgi:hypothetical protein
MSAIENEGFNGFPVPIGTVMMWANNSAKPQLKADLESYSGFLVCDGRCLLISEYPELYKVLGGAANPYNTNVPAPCPAGEFRLPNCPDPDAGAGHLGLLIGSTTAGTLVSQTPQVPIATAELTLKASQVPTFPLDYPAPNPNPPGGLYPPYTCNGTYYCFSSVDGSKINTNVYTDSNTLTRNPGGDLFLRNDVGYSSAGGIGNDAIAPQFTYTGTNTPIDITAAITQNTFTPPTFEIVPIIKASVKLNWASA